MLRSLSRDTVRVMGACILLAGLASGSPVAAASTAYTDLASFTAATTGPLTTADFEEVWGTSWTSQFSGYTEAGVSFAYSGTAYLYIGDHASLLASSNLYAPAGSDFMLGHGGPGNEVVATLPAGVTAVGIDLGVGETTTASSLTVTLGTGEVFVLAAPPQYSYQFFGVTSDVEIGSISWSDSAASRTIADNLVYGTAVPEPSTALLMLLGIGVAARVRKRA